MEMSQAKIIIEKIVADIEGRKGISNEWEEIDDGIKQEIKDEWLEIIMMNGLK